jgi:O-antigen ligase
LTRRLSAEQALAFTLGLLLFAVFVRGGNTRQAVVVASGAAVIGLALSALIAWRSQHPARFTFGSGFYVAAMVTLMSSALLALIPVSPDLWLSLPGRSAYREVVANLAQPPLDVSSLPLSIDPVGTSFATLSLLVAFAVTLATMMLPVSLLVKLLGVFAIIAITQAAIGILQLVFGAASFMGYSISSVGTRASGTFVNKNHYATLLAMALPLLIFRATGQFTLIRQNTVPTSLSNVWWGAATVLVAAALVGSMSRAGSVAGFSVAVVALVLCIFRKRATTRQRLGIFVIGTMALALVSGSSLKALLDSMQGAAFAENAEGRLQLARFSITGLQAFFPMGAGLGSYSIAAQRFQPEAVAGYVEHVHNDYIELIFETGVLGVAALICFLMAAVSSGIRLWRTLALDQRPLCPAIACWLGALAFAIHAWFDFPAHIPGLVIVVSLLFGASLNLSLLRSHERTRRSPPTLVVTAVTH